MCSSTKGILIWCCLIAALLGAAADHRCLICNSTEVGCEEGLPRFVGNCSLEETDGCFTRVVDGVLIRGCLSQLPTAEERQQCVQVEGGACISCTGNECNRHVWLKCLQCDDGEQICTDKQQARFCQQYRSEDHCFEMTRVVKDQDQPQTVRNCLSTLELAGMHCNQSEQCVVLATCADMVNMLAATDTSSKCLVCTSSELGEDEPQDCLQGTSEAQDCPQPTDKCFSRLHGDVLQRNCLSTLATEEQEACSDSNDATCVTCESLGCNTDRLPRCLQCKSSEDINCADPAMSSTLTATFCPRFQSSSSCFSRILAGEVERGCTSAPGLPENVCEENKNCHTCTDDGCNVLPEADLTNVQTCVRCGSENGDNLACETASVEPIECDGLIDQCFTRIQDGIVERNCLSTLPEEDQARCNDDDDKTCVACIGHSCNDYTWLRCFRCSKLQDPRCAAPETNDLSVALCDGFQLEGQCYAKVVGEDVMRGCVIDLGSVDANVCEDNPMCSVCLSDGCNSVDEDTLRRYTQCITCTTSTAEEKAACEQADSTATTVACGELDDVCFTRVKDGHLERGCLSTLDDAGQQQCKDSSDATCATCQDLSCNNASWLKCAKCTAPENPSCAVLEEPALEELSSYCARHTSQGTCYTKVGQDVLERGCTLELDEPESVCEGSSGCATCAVDNCNTHTKDSLLSGTKCVQCTSNDVESDCNGELANPEPCPNKDDRCFTRVADGTLTRNCLSSLDASVQEACTNPTDLSCIVCEESGCNNNPWIKCHQCDQSTQAACVDEQQDDDSTYCKSYNAEDKCYTKITSDRLERGCQSDAGSGVDICSDAEVCLTCQEGGCNNAAGASLVHTKCQQCTSTEDPQCALGAVEGKSCPLQNDPCYTAVNNDMALQRGCLSMLSEELREACNDEYNLSCVTCAESGCNGLQWPRCYRCQSSTDAECDSSLTSGQMGFCESYSETNLCYASIADGVLSRDCLGDASNVCENNNRCVACSSPGCNSVTKEELDAVHTCYQCDSSDGNCDVLEGLAQECNHRNDRCYTKLSEGVLTRGCLSDIDAEECAGNDQCLVCDGQECNNIPWPKCYQCSNITSADCSKAQQDIANLNYCHHYSETACYAMVEANSFVRGCVLDREDNECVGENSATCVICTGEGCNNLSQKSLFNPAFCQRCHSDLDPGCMEGIVESVRCDNPDDVCFYRRTSAKTVHRGCLSELSSSDQERCRSTTGRSCHTCDQNGCNSAKWRACFQCNSINDGGCELAQNDTTYLKLCEAIDDYCFEDQFDSKVRRGCGFFYCHGKKTCLECDQDGCNGHSGRELMPTHCLVCESSDPFCANGTRFDQYCDYLDEPCFSMVEDGTLYRGCFSRLREPHKGKCLDSTDKTCVTCNGNSCNREPWRLCIQCRSVELGHYCSREASVLKSHYCKRYKQDDGCYAKEVDGIVTRGCESEYDSPEQVCDELDKTQCFSCKDDNCNDRSLNGADRSSQLAIGLTATMAIVRCVLWFA